MATKINKMRLRISKPMLICSSSRQVNQKIARKNKRRRKLAKVENKQPFVLREEGRYIYIDQSVT